MDQNLIQKKKLDAEVILKQVQHRVQHDNIRDSLVIPLYSEEKGNLKLSRTNV